MFKCLNTIVVIFYFSGGIFLNILVNMYIILCIRLKYFSKKKKKNQIIVLDIKDANKFNYLKYIYIFKMHSFLIVYILGEGGGSKFLAPVNQWHLVSRWS